MKKGKVANGAICKRRTGLFKKARELAILCEAEIGLITFSREGIMNQYASSSMKRIIARYKKSPEYKNRPAPPSNSQQFKESEEKMAEEVDVVGQRAGNHTSEQFVNLMNFAGKHLAGMKSKDFLLLEDELVQVLLYSTDKKTQLLMEEFEQSRMHKQQLLMENQMLLKQLQGLVPPTYAPKPLSLSFREAERDAGSADGASSPPSTSFASLPSTSFAVITLFGHRVSVPSNQLSSNPRH